MTDHAKLIEAHVAELTRKSYQQRINARRYESKAKHFLAIAQAPDDKNAIEAIKAYLTASACGGAADAYDDEALQLRRLFKLAN